MIPHALKQANEDLLKSLARPSWNANDIERHITQFVHALHHLSGGKEELSRRAHFVKTQCASGSDFDKSRRAAVRYLTNDVVSQALFAVNFLSELDRPPPDTATMEYVAGAVGQLVRLTVDLPKPRAAFERWLRACNAVLLDAEHCQAEGCQAILNVWECNCQNPTTEALVHKGILFSDTGGWLRKKLKPAAESLLDWARSYLAKEAALANKLRASRSTRNKVVRRKRSSEPREGRLKVVAALTLHHEYANGGCLNFEPIGNNELARLAKVDKATTSVFFSKNFGGHRKYKAMCNRSEALIGALKLLNGDFAPEVLYGGTPPGESESDRD